MPKRAAPRTIGSEDSLARRVQREREKRGWSPAGLAERMTKTGCPMSQSAIWKIENGEPRRRITVDEAVAFAEVFEMSLEDLLVPPEVAESKEAIEIMRHLGYLTGQLDSVNEAIGGAWADLTRLIGKAHVQRMMANEVRYPNAFSDTLDEGLSMEEISEALDHWLDEIGERQNAAWAVQKSREEVAHGEHPEAP